LYLRVAQTPRSPDLAIFVLTTDNDRRQKKPITLPLAHARGVIIKPAGREKQGQLPCRESSQLLHDLQCIRQIESSQLLHDLRCIRQMK
ncbi:MAG: hypothetical protein MJE68_15550, partial [Proteobacteria bacterium]|nr:hypothetical protein [Pseudomonadota bacterium]